jgi:hypothetical protein
MQELLVGLIVLGCTLYAVWALLPPSWRRHAAQSLANGPWPAVVQRALHRAGDAGSCGGSGCKGCQTTGTGAQPPAGEQPIRFHPRGRTR